MKTLMSIRRKSFLTRGPLILEKTRGEENRMLSRFSSTPIRTSRSSPRTTVAAMMRTTSPRRKRKSSKRSRSNRVVLPSAISESTRTWRLLRHFRKPRPNEQKRKSPNK